MQILNVNTWLTAQLQKISDSAGFLTIDKTKYLFCLLLCYPLAVLFRLLPNNPTLKHIIGIVIGVWFGYFTIGFQLLHSFISSTVVYLIVKFLSPSLAHRVVFVFSMGYIMLSHIYRMYVDYMGWTLDFTGIQMLLTMKHIMYAFDVYDGSIPESELVHPSHVKTRLTRRPSILEYYGYIYFFVSFLAGPVFWMREYLSFIDMSLFNDNSVNGKETEKSNVGKIPPGSFKASMLRLGYALLVSIEVILQSHFPLRYVTTTEFASKPFLYKLWYQWFSASLIRGTYYFAWLFAEGSHILIGIGFNGYKTLEDGRKVVLWNRASNVRVLALELAPNFRETTKNWNISTSEKWLKNYIYLRLLKTKKWKAYAVHFTFVVSAFWHGFYPGYYASFGVAIIATIVARNIFRKVRPHFVRIDENGKEHPKSFKIFYDIAGILATNWMLTYIFSSFALLSLSAMFAMYKAVYFFGHIVLLSVGGIVSLLPAPPQRSRSSRDLNKDKEE